MPGSSNFEDLILRDIAANRPVAGIPGRLFYDTTNEKWQRDTGATWEDCEPTAGGGITGSGTNGTIAKFTGASAIGDSILLEASSDIYSTAWTDYSATSTVTGWSSFITKLIKYKKIGKLVLVQFHLEGTSNATTVSFTLADAQHNDGMYHRSACRVMDNGILPASPGLIELDPNSSTVNIKKDFSGAAFTASGTKIVLGSFWYQTA